MGVYRVLSRRCNIHFLYSLELQRPQEHRLVCRSRTTTSRTIRTSKVRDRHLFILRRYKIMGGGLFGTPLALNPKCLAFSGLLIAIYWMPPWAPLRSPYDIAVKRAITIGLAFTGYILMAWYDMWYDCNDQLKPTFLGWISAPFKPPQYKKDLEEIPLKWQKIVRTVDIIALLAAVAFVGAPFLMYSPSSR
jgi:hypothetical protein